MNWNDIKNNQNTKDLLMHAQKLGQFRANHPAIGAGRHQMLSKSPYVFERTFEKNDFKDKIVVALNLPKGKKSLSVKGFFGDGTKLYDTYSETNVEVKNGKITLDNEFDIAEIRINQNKIERNKFGFPYFK